MNRRIFLQLLSSLLCGLHAQKTMSGSEEMKNTQAGTENLCSVDARTLSRLIHDREISCSEMLHMHLEQIARLNPTFNAICTLEIDQAEARAKELDMLQSRNRFAGKLHGLPVAVKDLAMTKGIKTSMGSSIYKDFIPETDALFVQRMKQAGANIIGKTNTPEFGAGSHTFNEVFGITRNPYDASKTCGGSSGGAAVALATGMIPLADGSDLAGSLRNPAAWCNIVGFRPSPGRVPGVPSLAPDNPLPITGPMARSVSDVALLLSVMAGPDARAPLSLPEPGAVFDTDLATDLKGKRIAWTPDLGLYPVQTDVINTLEKTLAVFSDLGCEVIEAHPDLTGVDEVFQTLRGELFALFGAKDYENSRHLLKETVIWNIERGLFAEEGAVAKAWENQKKIMQTMQDFFTQYDYLVLPAVQVTPFPVEVEYPQQINDVEMHTYIDWMGICYAITTTLCPAISVPAGFTSDGMPTGLQMVAPHQADLDLLQLAYAFEQATGFAGQTAPACSNTA